MLIELHAFPPIAFFHSIVQNNGLVHIEGDENYNKRSFRNRIHLLGEKGLQVFSIPLAKGKNDGTKMRLVRISEAEDWRVKFTRMVKTLYGNTPYYEHFHQQIDQAIHFPSTVLYEYNWNALQLCLSLLDLSPDLCTECMYDPTFQGTDLREMIHPKKAMTGTPIYERGYIQPQGSWPLVSVLDLIFHLGPESRAWLKNMNLYSTVKDV